VESYPQFQFHTPSLVLLITDRSSSTNYLVRSRLRPSSARHLQFSTLTGVYTMIHVWHTGTPYMTYMFAVACTPHMHAVWSMFETTHLYDIRVSQHQHHLSNSDEAECRQHPVLKSTKFVSHFRDVSFRTINYTGTNNETHNDQQKTVASLGWHPPGGWHLKEKNFVGKFTKNSGETKSDR